MASLTISDRYEAHARDFLPVQRMYDDRKSHLFPSLHDEWRRDVAGKLISSQYLFPHYHHSNVDWVAASTEEGEDSPWAVKAEIFDEQNHVIQKRPPASQLELQGSSVGRQVDLKYSDGARDRMWPAREAVSDDDNLHLPFFFNPTL